MGRDVATLAHLEHSLTQGVRNATRHAGLDENVAGLKVKGLTTLLLAGLFVLITASPISGAGLIPLQNPKSNIAPKPNFLRSATCTSTGSAWSCDNPCVSSQTATFPIYSNNQTCSTYVLQVINAARKLENVPPMVLPTNWYSLTPQEQLFVVANLERTARGLPPYLGINRALDSSAQRAALVGNDPFIASGFPIGLDPQKVPGMGSAWSTGFTTLEVDFEWMYNDGWGGSRATTFNIPCTSQNAPACWGHRDELLGYDGTFNPGVGLMCKNCEIGTGYAVVNGHGSFADLIEIPASRAPPMTFTWAKNVLPYLTQF